MAKYRKIKIERRPITNKIYDDATYFTISDVEPKIKNNFIILYEGGNKRRSWGNCYCTTTILFQNNSKFFIAIKFGNKHSFGTSYFYYKIINGEIERLKFNQLQELDKLIVVANYLDTDLQKAPTKNIEKYEEKIKIENHKQDKFDDRGNLIHYKNLKGEEYWKEFDERNNLIHYKDLKGEEYWKKYDKNNNLIHYKNLKGEEYWKEFDENNNLIHSKKSNGFEVWYKYVNNKQIEISKQEFKQIKKDKAINNYLKNNKVSRFEIMDF